MAKKHRKPKSARGARKIQYIKISSLLVLLIFILLLVIVLFPGSRKKSEILLDDVQAMKIPPEELIALRALSEKYDIDYAEVLAVHCITNNFFPEKPGEESSQFLERDLIYSYEKKRESIDAEDLKKYKEMFDLFLYEMEIFPIPLSEEGDITYSYIYGDTWGAKREYGGDRIHLGTDLMDRDNIRGRIPIVSMTSGTVEKMGWNEKGGWRVGVRSENGNYYYYAHLESFSMDLHEGDRVNPGTLLGFMGDTGYSKTEGTTGNFVVHLHLGIQLNTDLSKDEFWINPYPFLRMLEAAQF